MAKWRIVKNEIQGDGQSFVKRVLIEKSSDNPLIIISADARSGDDEGMALALANRLVGFLNADDKTQKAYWLEARMPLLDESQRSEPFEKKLSNIDLKEKNLALLLAVISMVISLATIAFNLWR